MGVIERWEWDGGEVLPPGGVWRTATPLEVLLIRQIEEADPPPSRGAVSADVIAAGDALADAVSDIMAGDPESVLHTWARRWREVRPSTDRGAVEHDEDDDDWRCECGDLNRDHEAFCFRCGAGNPANA